MIRPTVPPSRTWREPISVVAGLCFTALILLWQGYPDRALACSEEALAAAHELRHAFTRATLCTSPAGSIRSAAGRRSSGNEPTR